MNTSVCGGECDLALGALRAIRGGNFNFTEGQHRSIVGGSRITGVIDALARSFYEPGRC